MSTIVPEGETGPEMSPSPTTGYFGQPAPPPAPQVSPVWATTNPPARRSSRRRRAGAGGVLLAAALVGLGVGRVVQGNGGATGATTAVTYSLAQLQARVDPALVDVVSTLDYGKARRPAPVSCSRPRGKYRPITTLSRSD